jgi:hypothetical protein
MTGKADFTGKEWELLCEGPATRGMVVFALLVLAAAEDP